MVLLCANSIFNPMNSKHFTNTNELNLTSQQATLWGRAGDLYPFYRWGNWALDIVTCLRCHSDPPLSFQYGSIKIPSLKNTFFKCFNSLNNNLLWFDSISQMAQPDVLLLVQESLKNSGKKYLFTGFSFISKAPRPFSQYSFTEWKPFLNRCISSNAYLIFTE